MSQCYDLIYQNSDLTHLYEERLNLKCIWWVSGVIKEGLALRDLQFKVTGLVARPKIRSQLPIATPIQARNSAWIYPLTRY
jgi:hypothetical protein